MAFIARLTKAFPTLHSRLTTIMPISIAPTPRSPRMDDTDERPTKKSRKNEPTPPVEILPDGKDEATLVREQMELPIEHVKKYEHEVEYRNKLVLAPMVRSGSCEH